MASFKYLFLLFAYHNAYATYENEYQPTSHIEFDIPPDFITTYQLPTKSITLEAYKVRSRHQASPPKWVSIGYPTITKTPNNQLFQSNSEGVTFHVKLLDNAHKNALVEEARQMYPTHNISTRNFFSIPLSSFTCRMVLELPHTTASIGGSVHDFSENPLKLTFPVNARSAPQITNAMHERIRNDQNPLVFNCKAEAIARHVRANSLVITADQIHNMDLAGKLLGPRQDARYVTRNQMKMLAQEVKTSMKIEEVYEILEEHFEEMFIEKILERMHGSFALVPIDRALEHMSKYGLPGDLTPQQVKVTLSELLAIETMDGKRYVVARDPGDAISAAPAASARLIYTAIGGNASAAYARSKKNDWKRGSVTLNQQVDMMNTNCGDSVQFAVEDENVVPASVDVAQVSTMALSQQMTFSRIKKKIMHAKYLKTITLTPNDARQETGEEATASAHRSRCTGENSNTIVCKLLSSGSESLQNLLLLPIYIMDRNGRRTGQITNALSVTRIKITGDTYHIGEHDLASFKNLDALLLHSTREAGDREGEYSTAHSNAFSELTGLQKLFMSRFRLGSVDVHLFDAMRDSLRLFECRQCQVFDYQWPRFTKLHLYTVYDSQMESIPKTAYESSQATLRYLILSRNNFGDVPDHVFRGLRELSQLDLSCNKISTIRTGTFDDLVNLNHLKLEFNRLQKFPVSLLQNTNHLETLALYNNQLVNMTSEAFAGKPNLTVDLVRRNSTCDRLLPPMLPRHLWT